MAPQAEGGAETIFVVEDDTLVRNFVTAQLQSLGYDTVAAPDSRAALDSRSRPARTSTSCSPTSSSPAA